MQDGNGGFGPLYGTLGGQQGINIGTQTNQGLIIQGSPVKQAAASLLAQQIEEVANQVGEVLKMSAEIRNRLVGATPENSNAQTNPQSGGGGVFGSASGRLHTIRLGLEESKRILSHVLGEV